MKKTISLLTFILLLAGQQVCSQTERSLFDLMTGSFTSGQQAAADSDFFDISLHMYPIWQEGNEQWLYVEQAVTAMQARPYRQRVYQLIELGPDSFLSQVYVLENEARFIGKWQEPAFFDSLNVEILSLREGCGVYLRRTGREQYEGETRGTGCESTLRGASYATSKVRIDAGGISSWDQGFDAEGKQVWGAVKGPYRFQR